MAQLQPLAADAELQVGINLLGLQESFRAARRGTPEERTAMNTGCLAWRPGFPAQFFQMLTPFWELGVRSEIMCMTSASKSRLIVCAPRQGLPLQSVLSLRRSWVRLVRCGTTRGRQ